MHFRTKLVASIWLLFGAIISVLLLHDLVRVGNELQRDPAVVLLAAPFVIFCIACFAFSYGLFTGRAFSRRLGVVLPVFVGALLLGYVALNAFMLLRASLFVSLLACIAGLLGIGFCLLTVKVSRVGLTHRTSGPPSAAAELKR
jgi:hypothetical protein